MSYVRSSAADRDVVALARDSAIRFGKVQTKRYLEELEKLLESIGHNPAIGRKRDELRPGLMSLLFRAHTVYYRIKSLDLVLIVRILHSSREHDTLI